MRVIDHMDNNIIEIVGLKKKYKRGSIGGHTLTEDIQLWMKEKLNKTKKESEKINLKLNEEFWALNGINLKIKQGDALGIIGINGAGKSTLLKILSRVTAPTEGMIKIYGKLTSMLEVGTGFHGELTGRQNIYLNGAILGMKKEEIDRKLNEIIEFSECGDFIDTPVKRYSSGMYVKLAFSVAAHLDSDIMIMDEVLAVGDAAFQKKCLEKMKRLADGENRTILYVSHNMNTIRKLCNRCIVLDKGNMIYDGTVDEAIKLYLNSTKKEYKTFYDYSAHIFDSTVCNGKVTVRSVELLGMKDIYVIQGNKIALNVGIQYHETVERLAVRCVILTMDSIAVGAAMSANIEVARLENKNNIAFTVDTSHIAPGRYAIDMILCNPNEYGSNEVYDVVCESMVIEIIMREGSMHNMQWSHNAWGYCLLPELKVHDRYFT